MIQEKEYILTQHSFNALKNRGLNMNCASQHCGKPLKPGDLVVRKSHGGRTGNRSKRYHKACWEALLIVC